MARQLFNNLKNALFISKIRYAPIITPVRCRVTSETGAFLPRPEKMQFGLMRVLLTVLPGLYLGATISKEGAAFLEENDIFVPDEDDEED